MTPPLLLLSCADRKVPGPFVMRALDRYDGPAFRMLRNHRKAKHPMPDLCILSAKYGLLYWDDNIQVYDQRMDEATANQLKYEKVNTDGRFLRLRLEAAPNHLCIAGGLYLDVFRHWAMRDLTIADGGIGDKLKALRLLLDGLKTTPELQPQLDLT